MDPRLRSQQQAAV